MHIRLRCIAKQIVLLIGLICLISQNVSAAGVEVHDGQIVMTAGIFKQTIALSNNRIRSNGWTINGKAFLFENSYPASRNFSFELALANPDRQPSRIQRGEADARQTHQSEAERLVYGSSFENSGANAVQWENPLYISGSNVGKYTDGITHRLNRPNPELTELTVSIPLAKPEMLKGVEIQLHYEVFEQFPVIRKRIEIVNHGEHWLRINRMLIEDFELNSSIGSPVFFTPLIKGIDPSIAGFADYSRRFGVIACNEIPSGMRRTTTSGTMGYNHDLFEWVLGPSETFESDPVFYFAFSGDIQRTVSSESTPMDRAVEGPLQQFLDRYVVVPSSTLPLIAPQWLTWAGLEARITDAVIRQQADIAARAGFKQLLIDDGWQKDRVGTDVDTVKFPDFAATAQYVRSLGLSLGLWVADYRSADSKDLRDMPDARIEPPLVLEVWPDQPRYAMSFASPWRNYYARDLVRLHEAFGVDYFKQDFCALLYGDRAATHESRTMKESLLRSLRGLLAAQDEIRRLAPGVVTELTHEIYWGNPGASCDIAALKHATQFHTPINDCRGWLPPWGTESPSLTADKHRQLLLQSCAQIRQRFYSHRGLPLYRVEFYAAETQNFQGSLTPQIQDRQVASMLMGAPLTFSGDLRWLTEDNIAHYRRRFDLLERLQQKYDVYRHYQFSGVPEPTDDDWHWWGKLNGSGHGAVVVLRGSGGEDSRNVNIPWIARDRSYRVTACFSDKFLGEFSGAELLDHGIPISLAPYGQEILEIADGR